MQLMQVVPSGDHICNKCEWRHLVAKFATYGSCAIWWPNLQLMQVAQSGGQICNLCKWRHLVAKFTTYASGAIWWPNLLLMQVAPYCCQVQSKLRSQFLGPLCLWQCLMYYCRNALRATTLCKKSNVGTNPRPETSLLLRPDRDADMWEMGRVPKHECFRFGP